MKNLFYLLIIMAITYSCDCDDTDVIVVVPETKKVSLNSKVNLSSDVSPVFNKKKEESGDARCEFPDYYQHQIPELFNVYFIPKKGGDVLSFENILEGNNEFEITAQEYTVVVTNSDKKYAGELPVYSTDLYLFGSKDIDFSKEDEATITVYNPYASIMVVNNESITSVPKVDGQLMKNVGDYFNIYTTKTSSVYLGINNDQEQVRRKYEINKVYRFILCPTSDLRIILQESIFDNVSSVFL